MSFAAIAAPPDRLALAAGVQQTGDHRQTLTGFRGSEDGRRKFRDHRSLPGEDDGRRLDKDKAIDV